jgi:signal transduction histidine kinase
VDNIVNEYHIHHKKGNYIVVRGIAKIIKDTTGERVRIIGGMQDITQYKEMQAKLEEYAKNLEGLVEEKTKQLTNAQVNLEEYAKNLEKLVEERTRQLQDKERLATIGQIAGMVGHDIRNPLQAIVNELYFAKQAMTRVPENKQGTLESISIIQEQVDYISKIVNDLQDYARTLKPEIKEVDLPELIASSFSIIKVPENIVLTVNIEDHLRIRTDPTFIRRTLTNLANNAIQAMPEGGKLTVTVSQKENQTTITVEDTGKGIPEEIKPKLFTPLFTTKSKGQGFGLAVSKRLIEALGGTMSFESEAGKGTVFIINFSSPD